MVQRTLIVMVKDPRAGRVKTRLGQDIGMTTAAWWFRHQTRNLLRKLRDPRWQIVLAVAPDRTVTSAVWPADLPRWPQGRGDLGARMLRMIARAPVGPTCVIGADIPDITRAHVARAFTVLGSHDAVFGPAQDGGYWLVGLRHRPAPRGMFGGVRWSTRHALADSLATLPDARVALIDTLCDVDRAKDLRR